MEIFSCASTARNIDEPTRKTGVISAPENWSRNSSRFYYYKSFGFEESRFQMRLNLQSEVSKNRLAHDSIAIMTRLESMSIGNTITQWLATERLRPIEIFNMTMADKITLIQNIGSALDFAHEKGVYNRNVVLGNIGVDPDQRKYKILDFGEALRVNQKLNERVVFYGDNRYNAPERTNLQSEGDARTDLHEFAMLAYYLFNGPSKKQWLSLGSSNIHSSADQTLFQPRDMLDEVYNLIQKAAHFDPEIRSKHFSSCTKLANDLKDALAINLSLEEKHLSRNSHKLVQYPYRSNVTRSLVFPIHVNV